MLLSGQPDRRFESYPLRHHERPGSVLPPGDTQYIPAIRLEGCEADAYAIDLSSGTPNSVQGLYHQIQP